MQGFKYSIELFQEEKYHELDYGIVFFVPGKNTPELNAYVKKNAHGIAKRINQSEEFWVRCNIKCLDANNDLFAQQEHACFYSAMLPTNENFNDGYSFLVACLDDLQPDVMDRAFERFFKTLLQMFDEVLDTGKYRDLHFLFPEMVQFEESELECVCIQLAEGESPISGLPPRRRLQSTRRAGLSKLVIDPITYCFRLRDYEQEIHLHPQEKALCILFLIHPEGIRMKEFKNYKDEFLHIYFHVTKLSDKEKIRSSVDKLFDACDKSALKIRKNRFKKALQQAIPDDKVRCYYEIESNRGRPHKIRLNRELVSMPDIFTKVKNLF